MALALLLPLLLFVVPLAAYSMHNVAPRHAPDLGTQVINRLDRYPDRKVLAVVIRVPTSLATTDGGHKRITTDGERERFARDKHELMCGALGLPGNDCELFLPIVHWPGGTARQEHSCKGVVGPAWREEQSGCERSFGRRREELRFQYCVELELGDEFNVEPDSVQVHSGAAHFKPRDDFQARTGIDPQLHFLAAQLPHALREGAGAGAVPSSPSAAAPATKKLASYRVDMLPSLLPAAHSSTLGNDDEVVAMLMTVALTVAAMVCRCAALVCPSLAASAGLAGPGERAAAESSRRVPCCFFGCCSLRAFLLRSTWVSSEKELGVLQLMRALSMLDSAYWCSWHLVFLAWGAVLSLGLASAVVGFGVLGSRDALFPIHWVAILLTFCATTSLCLTLVAFAKSSRSSNIARGAVFFFCVAPAVVIPMAGEPSVQAFSPFQEDWLAVLTAFLSPGTTYAALASVLARQTNYQRAKGASWRRGFLRR